MNIGKLSGYKGRTAVWLTALVMLAGVFLGGCGQPAGSPPAGASGRIPVVATIYPLAFFAREVGGERVKVTQLLPAGAEPHEWEPSPRDMQTLYQGRLVIYNGAGLEPWVSRVLPSLREKKGIRVLEVSRGLPLLSLAEEERQGWTVYLTGTGGGPSTGVDPHVWLDPVLAKSIVSKITMEMIAVDPAGKRDYLRNAQALQNRLDRLDRAYAEASPAFHRKGVLVAHPAYGYLGRRYGLRQIPVLGLVPEQEPDAATLGRIVDYGRRHGVRYVFTEPAANPQVAGTVARELGGKVLTLHPLESLSRQEQEAGRDYFKIMAENLAKLKQATGE